MQLPPPSKSDSEQKPEFSPADLLPKGAGTADERRGKGEVALLGRNCDSRMTPT